MTTGNQEKSMANRYPAWSPRFWHGMLTRDYLRLLAANRYRIAPTRIPTAGAIAAFSIFNSWMALLQEGFYGKRIRSTAVDPPPLFVLGHWRSGTTMVHELVSHDPRLWCPTTFECFVPHHCLVTQRILGPLLATFLPRRRPMDNMPAGVNLPQEDEFALCSLGAPSPYLRLAFPNHPPPHDQLIDMKDVPPEQLERFRLALHYFLQTLTVKHPGRRMVLKSPPHTGRIAMLHQWYPDAKFIHISRNPYQLFSSTLRLWTSLDQLQGFHIPRYSAQHLKRYVLNTFCRMYDAYFGYRHRLGPDQLVEIRYEDLVADPLGVLQSVYDQLQLGSVTPLVGGIREYCEKRKEFRGQPAELDSEITEQINHRWRWYFEHFGYQAEVERDHTRVPISA